VQVAFLGSAGSLIGWIGVLGRSGTATGGAGVPEEGLVSSASTNVTDVAPLSISRARQTSLR